MAVIALLSKERREVVDRVLDMLGASVLSDVERRVLRTITEGVALGEMKKARDIARETGLTMEELEQVCDRLLEKGFIGPERAK